MAEGGTPEPSAVTDVPLDEGVYRRLVELAPDGMLAHRNGRILWCNDAAAAMVGLGSAAEATGRSVMEFVAPESRAVVAERIRQMIASGRNVPAIEENFQRLDDGRPVPVEVAASPIGGGIILVVARDIGARRAAAQQEARYQELFDRVPVGVWEEDLSGTRRILDALRAEGVTDLAAHLHAHPEVAVACVQSVRILDVNATAVAMLGARDKEELLANLDKVFLPESLPDFTVQLLQLWVGRRETLTEGWNGTLDGRRVWLAVRGRPAVGHEEDWARYLVTTVDVTERRQAAEERERLQDRLRHAEKMEAVGRLAGGVSHDFNNILAAVLGLAEASLQQAPPGSALAENQRLIREAALRARDLVGQILTFSRRDRPEPRPMDVAAAVGEALPLARAGIPSGVTMDVRIDPEAGSALADPVQIHQLVLNLCSNACNAVGERGRIEVSVAAVNRAAAEPDLPAGDWIRLRVRDDGVGMDAGTRARIFEPYMTTRGRAGGHGLGLAVVHGIVSGCGGVVRVKSAPGAGSTFDVWLPRLAASPRPPAPAACAPRGSARILLVEDDPLVRQAHCRVLGSLGYVVDEAVDGVDALERLRANPEAYDLVLTDQAMPRMNGTELARTHLADRPGARVVLVTGYSDAVDEEHARALGLRALLPKPSDRATLAETVARALRD